MTRVNLDQVIERLFEAAILLGDLIGETHGNERLERSLAAIDLMVASGIREIHQGRRVNRAEIIILGSIRGYNRAALGNLEGLVRLSMAKPFLPRLERLRCLIRDVAEDPVPVPEACS